MKHYIRQKTDNSIQYTRHLIHKPRSIVLSKGHLTRNTFKSNIFMLINKLIVKFYVHGSLGVLQSWYLAYWWVSNCFFHELSYVKSLDFGPTFFVVIFNVICLTINNLSGILDTTDTSFVHPWVELYLKLSKQFKEWQKKLFKSCLTTVLLWFIFLRFKFCVFVWVCVLDFFHTTQGVSL